jgi:hypothetical protein
MLLCTLHRFQGWPLRRSGRAAGRLIFIQPQDRALGCSNVPRNPNPARGRFFENYYCPRSGDGFTGRPQRVVFPGSPFWEETQHEMASPNYRCFCFGYFQLVCTGVVAGHFDQGLSGDHEWQGQLLGRCMYRRWRRMVISAQPAA